MEKVIRRTRTVRRFLEHQAISRQTLIELIALARWAGSARNAQVLKFMPVVNQDVKTQIFPLLGWAGYLQDWLGPAVGERPAAYIICLQDMMLPAGREAEVYCDVGIATQNILLGAAEQGIYGCRVGAFSATALSEMLALPDNLRPLLVLALGYPGERIEVEDVNAQGSVRYWHEGNVHHVPKRCLEDIVVSGPFKQ